MPSPVGHSLLGLAIGLMALLKTGSARGLLRQAWHRRGALFVALALANAPDVDYLPGLFAGDLNAYHHLLTHTMGWCVVVSVGCWMLARATSSNWRSPVFLVWGLALTGSHLLADWLTADARPPLGIMALWPLDDRFFIAPATVFWRLHKRDFSEFLQWHNAQAVAVEAAWCLPVVALAWAIKCRTPRGHAGP